MTNSMHTVYEQMYTLRQQSELAWIHVYIMSGLPLERDVVRTCLILKSTYICLQQRVQAM